MAFERLCTLSKIPHHTLYLIYKEILSHTHCTLPIYTKFRSRDLKAERPLEDWLRSFMFIHKSLISCYAQEYISNYYLKYIRTRFPSIRSFLTLQTSAGAVTEGKERICMHGGNVTESVLFGNTFSWYMTKSMMSLMFLLLRLLFYLSYRVPLNLRNLAFSDFFLSAAHQLISRFWKTKTTPLLNLWVDPYKWHHAYGGDAS